MQIMDILPTALVCVVEAVVVFGIDLAGNALKPFLGIADEGVSLMVFLAVKLLLQFVFGIGSFFGLSYMFRLKPLREYARVVSSAIRVRMPRLAAILERRFCDCPMDTIL